MVISLYPGQAAEEVEKQVTIPVERALTGVPQRPGAAVDHLVRALAGDPHLRGRRRHLLRAPAGRRALARRRGPRRASQPHLGPNDTPVGQVYQYTLESDRHTPSELRSWQDWVVSKHLMRMAGVADVVSFGGFQKEYHVLCRPGAAAQQRAHAARPDRGRLGVERRDLGRLHAVRRVGVRGARARLPANIAGHREHGRARRPNGTPVLVRDRRQGRRGVHAAPGRGRARRGHRFDRGDHPAPPRREPQGRARPASTQAVDRINKDVLPTGMQHRAVLRPHAPGRHHAQHRVAQHARGRVPGQPRAVAVPARGLGLDRGRHHHAAGAAHRVRGPLLRGRAGEPAVDGGDRLRHLARRRGHPGRERLPAPGRGAAAARGRARGRSRAPPRRCCGRRCSRCRSSRPR